MLAVVFWSMRSRELSIQGKFLWEKYFQVICAVVYPAVCRIDRDHWAMHCDAWNVWPRFAVGLTVFESGRPEFWNRLTSFKTGWPVLKRADPVSKWVSGWELGCNIYIPLGRPDLQWSWRSAEHKAMQRHFSGFMKALASWPGHILFGLLAAIVWGAVCVKNEGNLYLNFWRYILYQQSHLAQLQPF